MNVTAVGKISWEQAVRSLIDDPTQVELVEACYFDLPLQRAAMRYATSPEWLEIRRLIGTPSGVAVDVGAGNGIVSFALARDGWHVIAVEPDPSDLVGAGAIRELCRNSGIEIDVRAGVGERLPIDDASVSLVVARQVLHHASNLSGFCSEIARILKPGGMLLSLRDHVISGPEQLLSFLASHPLHSLYGGENAFELGQYKYAIKNAGLTIEREFGHFDSVINYAPYTPETIRAELAARAGPLGGLVKVALGPKQLLGAGLAMLSLIDRRPGRLVSFLCRKR